MSVHVISGLHSVLAAIALIVGVQLLKLPYDQDPAQTPATPNPDYIQEFEAYNFNHGFDSANNSGPIHGQSSDPGLPFAAPFFLGAIELAVLSLCVGMKSVIGFICSSRSSGDTVPSRREISESFTYFFQVTLVHSQFADGTCIFLLSPLLALCAATQYAIWASSVQASTPTAVLSLFLLSKLIFMLFLAKLSQGFKRTVTIPSISNSLTHMVSLLAIVGLLSFDRGPAIHLNGEGCINALSISLFACLTHFGPWLNGNVISAKNVHPLLIAVQAMIASIFALFVSIMTESSVPVNESFQHLTVFGSVLFVSLGLRVLIPIAAPIVSLDVLCDQFSLILAWMLGFTDSSAVSVKIIFLVLATTVVLLPQYGWPSTSYGTHTQYSVLPSPTLDQVSADKSGLSTILGKGQFPVNKNNIVDSRGTSKYVYLVVFRILSIATLVLGLYLVVNQNNYHRTISNSPIILESDSNTQQYGVNHLHNAIPKSNVVKHVTSVFFEMDPDISPMEISMTKQSRQFSVNAHSHDIISRNESTYDVLFPPVETLPRRANDPITNLNEIPEHAADLSFDHIQFGISSNVKAVMRIAFSAHSWASDPQIQWTVFWNDNDDPNGMTGELSYALESFKAVVGRYPVVMQGNPKLKVKLSQNIKWFKMLPYLYKQAPRTTRWFLLCDDDTLIFPHALLSTVRSVTDNPLTTSMYIGDISENHYKLDKYGRTLAYGGGGALISRHLAERIYNRYQWCLQTISDPEGDALLKTCIINVTQTDGLGAVYLTRNPAFNQVDMHRKYREGGREYISAKLSRAAPVTMHHLSLIPGLLVGMSDSTVTNLAMFDFWHLIQLVPLSIRFRRFFIHLGDGRTAVVTFGLHVRVYQNGLDSIEHPVDWDSNIVRDPTYVGIPFILDSVDGQVPRTDLIKRQDYTDYWLLHHADNTLVFSNDQYTHQFHLKCKLDHFGILSLCSESV